MTAAPPPKASLEQVHAVLVGFDYADASRPELPELRGMTNDVIAEWRLLQRLGVWPSKVRILTDRPVDEMQDRLEHAGVWHADLKPGLAQATTALDILQVISAKHWVPPTPSKPGQMMALITPESRAILFWSGHGASAAPHLPPRLYLPDGTSISVAEALDALAHLHGWKGRDGRKPGDMPCLLAFLNACHSAALTLGGALDDGGDGEKVIEHFGDLGAVVMAASNRHQKAHEIFVEREWRGAMSWAVTTLLSRYDTQADGAVDLTYSELHHRVRNLLAAVDVADEPLLFTPLAEGNRRILRGYGDLSVGARTATAGDPIEVYPTNGKTAVVYDISRQGAKTGNHVSIGKLVMVGGDASAWDPSWAKEGYVADRMVFVWDAGIVPFDDEFDVVPSFDKNNKQITVPMTAPWSAAVAPSINGAAAVSEYAFGTWKQASSSTPSPSHVITSGANIQRWVNVHKTTRNGKTVHDLTFYRDKNTQTTLTPAQIRLAFRRITGAVSGVTDSVEEPQS